MKAHQIVLLAATLTACARSPIEVRETGQRSSADSKQAPINAATCIVHNVERMSFGAGAKAIVQLRPLAKENSYEVIAYGPLPDHGALAVAEVTQAPGGSGIVMWRNPDAFLLGIDQLRRMADGC